MEVSNVGNVEGVEMSMFDVARFLYFSRSIDLSREENRYFNLNMVGAVRKHAYLHVRPRIGLLSPACVREKCGLEDPVVMPEKGR